MPAFFSCSKKRKKKQEKSSFPEDEGITVLFPCEMETQVGWRID